MANLSAKKTEFLNQLINFASQAEALTRNVAELNNYFADNGFATAGGNAIVDGDCIGNAQHLTAALVNSAMAAIVNVNLNASQRTTMRQVAATSIPPS